jgi:hypothetical protein
MVFGPGTEFFPPYPGTHQHTKGYGVSAVTYDEQSNRYACFGLRSESPSYGVTTEYGIYATSTTGSFSAGEGESYTTATLDPSGGEDLGQPATSAAGGKGQFVHGLVRFPPPPHSQTSQAEAHFVPGSMSKLASTTGDVEIWQGSYCFNSKAKEGVFACASFGKERAGGIYVAAPNAAFKNTKSGKGIDTGFGGIGFGAVAVGRLSFLGTT